MGVVTLIPLREFYLHLDPLKIKRSEKIVIIDSMRTQPGYK